MIEPTGHNAPLTALITGASDGIGRAFARELATAGYHVTAVARTEAKLRALTGQLGPGHGYLVADLTTRQGQDTVVTAMSRTRYNLLVNNAGVSVYGPFIEVGTVKRTALAQKRWRAERVPGPMWSVAVRDADAGVPVT